MTSCVLNDFLATYTTEQMVVLDESSKDGKTLIRKYGRALSGEDAVLHVSLDRSIASCLLLSLMGILLFVLLKTRFMVKSSLILLSMIW